MVVSFVYSGPMAAWDDDHETFMLSSRLLIPLLKLYSWALYCA